MLLLCSHAPYAVVPSFCCLTPPLRAPAPSSQRTAAPRVAVPGRRLGCGGGGNEQLGRRHNRANGGGGGTGGSAHLLQRRAQLVRRRKEDEEALYVRRHASSRRLLGSGLRSRVRAHAMWQRLRTVRGPTLL